MCDNRAAYASQAICESVAAQCTRPLLEHVRVMHVGLNVQLKWDKTFSELN
jgi:hypothetical protein